MTEADSANGATPGTYVQLGPAATRTDALRSFGRVSTAQGELSPDLALILAAVLLAAAEQVNARKLGAFKVTSPADLTMLQLSMAFRGDDTGLVGDVFEWSLLLSLNGGDPGISPLVMEALDLCRVSVDQPQAVLVAAESGRLVSFSPDLPPGATLATGRRGRPPQVANLMQSADTRTWKADLLLGSGQSWVSASLKSNPSDLQRSLRVAATTAHPPRIGITSSHEPGLTTDDETGAVLVHVPVYGDAMALSKLVLEDVRHAFSRHLSLPSTPLQQDATGIGRQLARWQDRTVGEVATALLHWSSGSGLDPLFAWSPMATGASAPGAGGALIAVNTLVDADRWRDGDRARPDLLDPETARQRYGDFDPID